MKSRVVNGFTLIELMVTVAIVAILAAIALPSYQQHIVRGYRSTAQTEMLDLANREQQFLLANKTYADKAAMEASGYSLPADLNGRYTYDIGVDNADTPPTFTVTFTATGAQAGDGNLTINEQGVKLPAGKW